MSVCFDSPVCSMMYSFFYSNHMYCTLTFLCFYLFTSLVCLFTESHQPQTFYIITKVWKRVSVNSFICLPLLNGLTSIIIKVSDEPVNWSLQYMAQLVCQLLVCLVCYEIFFYSIHRMFHEYKSLYRYHRIHHRLKVPIGVAAMYSHPIEFIVCIYFPAIVGVLVLSLDRKVSMTLLILWNVLTAISSVITHCADIPGLHLIHHEKSTSNFGSTGFMDMLFHTYSPIGK